LDLVMSDSIDKECLKFLRGSLEAMPVVIRCSLLKPKASASDRHSDLFMAQRAVQRPTWIARMRAKLLTSLRRSSRSSRKFAMDIPQHGCGTRPIIICAALRLRRGKLHRSWDPSFMVQIRLTDSLALIRSPPVKPALAAIFVDQPPRRNRPGTENRGLRQNKRRWESSRWGCEVAGGPYSSTVFSQR
jgi:hypothetical protein